MLLTRQRICSRRSIQAPTGVFPPNESAGLSARSCRPILRNGNPLLKFLGNAFTGERILQRPTPRHLWATGRPAENVLPNLTTTAVVPGSWAYEQRGQPNEEADCDSSCRCQEDSNDEKDSR